MRLQHSTTQHPLTILEGGGGVAGACMFFSVFRDHATERDLLCSAYIEGMPSHIYTIQIEDSEAVEVSRLALDDQAVKDIIEAARCHDDFVAVNAEEKTVRMRDPWTREERDLDIESILDGSEEAFVDLDGEFPWTIQRIRSEAAMRAGYFCVLDRDDQGQVAIVATSGREDEINRKLVYLGVHKAGKRFPGAHDIEDMEEGEDYEFAPDLRSKFVGPSI